MNKPRPIRNKHGEITGYKVEVKWRGQRYYFTRRTAAAAQTCWAKAIADLEANIHPYDRYKHERPTKAVTPMTVGEWIAIWHPRRRLSSEASRKNQTNYIDTHIVPSLGPIPLPELTRMQIQAWVWSLEEEYMPRYVRTLFGVLRLALLDAVDEAGVPLEASPAVRIRMEPPDPTGREALTPMQVAAIASRCGIHETLIWTLAFTGARIRELLKRDVGDWSPFTGISIAGKRVDPAEDGGTDEDAPRRRKKGAKKAKASKTAAGARTILVCPSHSAMLRDYLGGRTSGPLFIGQRGQRATYSPVYETLGIAVERARTVDKTIPEGVSPHWFRVTARTWMDEAHVPERARDEQIGHSTQGMGGVYGRVTDAMRQEIRDALEDRWKQAMAAPGRLRKADQATASAKVSTVA